MKKETRNLHIKPGLVLFCIFVATMYVTAGVGNINNHTRGITSGRIIGEGGHEGDRGSTIYVDDDYTEETEGWGVDHFNMIQGGIDAASDGDTVLVMDGTYTGSQNKNLDFSHNLPGGGNRAITVCSENGPLSCIIDCQGSTNDRHRGFIFHNGEKRDSIVKGFTIKNGLGPDKSPVLVTAAECDPPEVLETSISVGGAILCDGASPTIEDCIIRDNRVAENTFYYKDSQGAAIYGMYASPLIKNCMFINNQHEGNEYEDSSSTLAFFSSLDIPPLEITMCNFIDNDQSEAIHLHDVEVAWISSCTIYGGDYNLQAKQGMAIYHSGIISVENCNIYDPCYDSSSGTGIHCSLADGSKFFVNDSTIWGWSTGIGVIHCTGCYPNPIPPEVYISHTMINTDGGNGLVIDGSYLTIRNSSIIHGAESEGYGCGIRSYGNYLDIDRCIIAGYYHGASLIDSNINNIRNSLFINRNTGIFIDNSQVHITGCTIAGTANGDENGESLWSWIGTINVVNSILWNSHDDNANEVYNFEDSTITLAYCDIQGGVPDDYGIIDGGGNIDLDPKFVNFSSTNDGCMESREFDKENMVTIFTDNDTEWTCGALIGKFIDLASDENLGLQCLIIDNSENSITVGGKVDINPGEYRIYDYHLQWDPQDQNKQSPCVDAGDPDFIPEEGETDIDGDPRVFDGNNDSIAIVDMGADEYIPETAILTINSSPSVGIEISVSPPDIWENAGGVTLFTREYVVSTEVTLTAPKSYTDTSTDIIMVFYRWIVDQQIFTTKNQITLEVNTEDSYLEAKYGPLGDVNGDGVVDGFDIQPFVYALTEGEEAFYGVYPDGCYWAADCNQDGVLDGFDIQPFIELLLEG